jgi:hypothetical protein
VLAFRSLAHRAKEEARVVCSSKDIIILGKKIMTLVFLNHYKKQLQLDNSGNSDCFLRSGCLFSEATTFLAMLR